MCCYGNCFVEAFTSKCTVVIKFQVHYLFSLIAFCYLLSNLIKEEIPDILKNINLFSFVSMVTAHD